jgi:hypothetical protein
MTQTVWLRGEHQRRLAHQLIDKAPINAVVKISPEQRSLDQNNKMWAMISDVSRQHQRIGIMYQKYGKQSLWLLVGMRCSLKTAWTISHFPIGFRSSNLSKAQMADLIEYMYFYGSKHDIKWSEEYE